MTKKIRARRRVTERIPRPQHLGRQCVGCGCRDLQACETESGPCSWHEVSGGWWGLCSACADILALAKRIQRRIARHAA